MDKPRKIYIVGMSASGKTTLSKTVGEYFNLPVFESDSMCLNNDFSKKPTDEIDKILEEMTDREDWVIDGLHRDIADKHISKADMVIFIKTNIFENVKNVIKRKLGIILSGKGKSEDYSVRKIRLVNTRQVCIERKAYFEFWDGLLEKHEGEFELMLINGVNKRTTGMLKRQFYCMQLEAASN